MEAWTFKTGVGDRSYSLIMSVFIAACTVVVSRGGLDGGFYLCVTFLALTVAVFILGGGDQTLVDSAGIHPRRWYVRRPSLPWADIVEIKERFDYNRGGRYSRRLGISVVVTDGRRVQLPAPVRRSPDEIHQDIHLLESFQSRGRGAAAN